MSSFVLAGLWWPWSSTPVRATLGSSPGRPEAVRTVLRCSAVRELDRAWIQAQGIGLDRGWIRIQAAPLWAYRAAPIRIQIGDELQATSASKLTRPARVELYMNGQAISGVLAEAGGDPATGPAFVDPAGLIREIARSRNLSVDLERLRGEQIQPLVAGAASSLWKYGFRISGAGALTKLRQFLSDLDGLEWLLHVENLELSFKDSAGTFAIEGVLLVDSVDTASCTAPLEVGQQRLLTIDEGQEVGVSPREALSITRLSRRLAVITAHRAGRAILTVKGAGASQTVPVAVQAPHTIDVSPAWSSGREPRPEDPSALDGGSAAPLGAGPGLFGWSGEAAGPPGPAGRPIESGGTDRIDAHERGGTASPPRVPLKPVRPARLPPFPAPIGTCPTEPIPRALFSDKDAREGERIGAYRLDQVLEEGVRLSWNGRRFFVPVDGAVREEVEVGRSGDAPGSANVPPPSPDPQPRDLE